MRSLRLVQRGAVGPQRIYCPRLGCRRLADLTGGRYDVLELVDGKRRDLTTYAARCPEHGLVFEEVRS